MKIILTISAGGDRETLAKAMLDAFPDVLAQAGATRGAFNTPVVGPDYDTVKGFDTGWLGIDAVVTLADAPGAVGDLTLPPGANLVGAYLVHEIVQRDYERTWGAGEPSPGVNVMCFVHRTPALSHEAYSDHWRLRHGPLALRRQPGFWRYVQNHVDEHLTPGTPDFDGIGELHFRTAQDVLDKMFDSPEGTEEIMEDTYRFMAHETSGTVPTTEHLFP